MQLGWFAVHLYRKSDASGSTIRSYVRVLPAALWFEGLQRWEAGIREPELLTALEPPAPQPYFLKALINNMAVAGSRKEQELAAASVLAHSPAPLSIEALRRALTDGLTPAAAVAVLQVWRLGVRPSTSWATRYATEIGGEDSMPLHWDDYVVANNGVTVSVRREKTYRQIRDRHPIHVERLPDEAPSELCLVRALERLAVLEGLGSLEAAAARHSPVIRELTDAAVVDALQAHSPHGHKIGLRSIRRGAATLLAASGISHRQLMLYGFWRSDATPATYIMWGYHTSEPSTDFLVGMDKAKWAAMPISPSLPAHEVVKVVWDSASGFAPGPRRWSGLLIAFAYYRRLGFADLPANGGRILWFDNVSGTPMARTMMLFRFTIRRQWQSLARSTAR